MNNTKEISDKIRDIQMELWAVEKELDLFPDMREKVRAARIALGNVDRLLLTGKQ